MADDKKYPGNGLGVAVDALVAERMGIPLEELTQERAEAWQLEAFRRTVLYVQENSDYYRAALAGIDPDSIQSMDDLKSLPTTSEDDLAGNEWRFQCVSASEVGRIVTVPTTGTRGKRKRLCFTERDQQRAIDFIYRGYLTMHCTRGERMLVWMSGNTAGSIGDLVRRAMAPLEMEIKVSGAVADIPTAYEQLMDFRPAVVEALPWHAAAVARYGTRYGNPEREFIRSVNLSADVVPDAVVSRLERLWGCSVHRHYGSTEMCIFGGVECIHHGGYHMRPCDILLEIPEPDAAGLGEIVITTLDREAMPLIRYRTGDIGRFADEPCACGCRLRRLERVCGRKSSLIRLGGAEFFLSDLADALYQVDETVDFEIEMVGEQDVNITVKTLPGESADERQLRERLMTVPGMERAAGGGACRLRLFQAETLSFPEGYNLKKNITCS